MKKIIVLGSNSFSGQDLIDVLLDNPNYTVIGVSRSAEKPSLFLSYKQHAGLSRYRFIQCDINSHIDVLFDLLDAEKPDYIVNFAAQSEVAPSWVYPEHWFQTNTVALAKLVNFLKDKPYLKKYLHISSPEVYGSCTGTVTEDATLNPSTPYAASKAAADMLLSTYQKQFGFPLVTVRATNVYGARQQLFKIIPRSVIYMKSGKIIQLHGGGQAIKSYIHIRDVSRAELLVLEQGSIGDLYHISPDQGIRVADVVQRIANRLSLRFDEVTQTVDERPGQDAAYVIDSSKIRSQLSWSPEISFDEGIADVCDWVASSSDILSKNLEYTHIK